MENSLNLFFFEHLFLLDTGADLITALYQNKSQTNFFSQILKKTYEKVPEQHPYKLFQFMNLDDEPCLEIICEHLEIRVLDE